MSQTSVNFQECLGNITMGIYGPIGLNSIGQAVNVSQATAVSYSNCVKYCGGGQEPFEWSIFSQQFSSWLLPWLALVSQLPFGANDKLDNLEAMLLTVGSPALASYSLVLTTLNGRWIARRFSAYRHYPNVRSAIVVLSSLQQAPLRVISDHGEVLLASLIVLPQNDNWWRELMESLDYTTYSWSISAATSIAWVIIAYVFTVVDSFIGNVLDAIESNGQGVGSLWLWLLPIVVGWLQISPKCDSNRLRKIVEKANTMAYVAQKDGDPILAQSISDARAFSLDFDSRDSLRVDEQCTVPIYNYARFFPWIEAVERVSDTYQGACCNAQRHKPVSCFSTWESTGRGQTVRDTNRVGNACEVVEYCAAFNTLEANGAGRRWGTQDTFRRMLIASGLALMLQWGTTGAAVVVVWFTPTSGLGCRSASYLVYGILSTVAWIFLVISSILSHYSTTFRLSCSRRRVFIRNAIRSYAILFRRTGKVVASLNAIWIIVSCMFQFTSFFDRCYCNSSVFGLREKAYNVISPLPQDVSGMRTAWSGGVGLAGGSALIFILFVNLLINPSLPD